jgi:hypothetical protein
MRSLQKYVRLLQLVSHIVDMAKQLHPGGQTQAFNESLEVLLLVAIAADTQRSTREGPNH